MPLRRQEVLPLLRRQKSTTEVAEATDRGCARRRRSVLLLGYDTTKEVAHQHAGHAPRLGIDGIEHAGTLAAGSDETGILQLCDVLRDGSLRQRKLIEDGTERELAGLLNHLEDGNANGMADSLGVIGDERLTLRNLFHGKGG